MKNIKWSSILGSALYIGAGVYLWLNPGTSFNVIAQIISIGAIVLGVLRMLLYMMMDVRTILFRNDFVEGMILVLFGALVYSDIKDMAPFVPYLMSSIIMISGFSRLQDGVDVKRIGFKHALIIAVLCFPSIAVGLFTLFELVTSGKVMTYFYAGGLIYAGITDLLASIYLSTRIFKFYSEQRKEKENADKIQREKDIEAEVSRRVEVLVKEELKRIEDEKMNTVAEVTEPAEESAEEKKSFLSGLFGKKEESTDEAVPAEETVTEPREAPAEKGSEPVSDEVPETMPPSK